MGAGGALAGGGTEEEGAATGKGGGGGADKKDGAGGDGSEAKRDPLKEAMEAISSVSGAIKTGIDAAKSVWTEFMGAPPDSQLDKLFLWLDDLMERALKLADNAMSVEEADGVQRAMDALNGTFGAMTSAIDMSSALFRMRTPPVSAVTKVFEFMGQIVKAAMTSIEEMDLDDLQDAVKQTTFMQEMGTIVQTWAASLTAIADASNAVAGSHMDVSLAPVFDAAEYIFHRAAFLVNTMAANESETRPFALVDQQMKAVAESIGAWTGTLSGVADLIAKSNLTRLGGSFDGLMTAAMQVMNIGVAINVRRGRLATATTGCSRPKTPRSSGTGWRAGSARSPASRTSSRPPTAFTPRGVVRAGRRPAPGCRWVPSRQRWAACSPRTGRASSALEKTVAIQRYRTTGTGALRDLLGGVVLLINDIAGEQVQRLSASGHFDLLAQDIAKMVGEAMSAWRPRSP
ncbi:MAG: hypothetical protein IPG34_20140 [Rhodocyclaceae bacterium]|nr:hypothetical protein [Rhodocyclaceae bacterium]